MAKRWHVRRGDDSVGPFTADQLRGMAGGGMLAPDAAVRREDRPEGRWVRADQLRGLFAAASGEADDSGPPGEREFFEEVGDGERRRGPRTAGRGRGPRGGGGRSARRGRDARDDAFEDASGDDDTVPVAPPTAGDLETRHPLDLLLPAVRAALPEVTCRAVDRGVWHLGRWPQWFTLAAFFLYGVTAGLKVDGVQLMAVAALATTGLLLLQYWAQRTSGAIRAVVAAVPVRVRSRAVVDGCAATAPLGAAAVPAWMRLTGFQTDVRPVYLLPAVLGAFAALLYLGVLALHPGMLNVRADPAVSAGEEAVGVLSLVLRLVLQFVPVAYAVGMTVDPLPLLAATGDLLQGGGAGLDGLIDGPLTQLWVLWVAALPLSGYAAFLRYSLLIDLIGGQFLLIRTLAHAAPGRPVDLATPDD